jgi:hypothetical protein
MFIFPVGHTIKRCPQAAAAEDTGSYQPETSGGMDDNWNTANDGWDTGNKATNNHADGDNGAAADTGGGDGGWSSGAGW